MKVPWFKTLIDNEVCKCDKGYRGSTVTFAIGKRSHIISLACELDMSLRAQMP